MYEIEFRNMFQLHTSIPIKDDEFTTVEYYWGETNGDQKPHGWGVSFFTMESPEKRPSCNLLCTGMWENGLFKSHGPDINKIDIAFLESLLKRRQ
jgi:hypothetical protein